MHTFRKRQSKRNVLNAHIIHSMYNHNNHRKSHPNGYFDNHHDGIIQNVSREGMRIKSAVPCRIGSKIYMSLLGDIQRLKVSKKTGIFSGKVVWNKKSQNEPKTEYEIGIRFDN